MPSNCTFCEIGAGRGQRIRCCDDRIAVVGQEQRVGVLQRRRHGARGRGAIGAILFKDGDAAATFRHRLLERGLDHIAVGVFRQHRPKGAFADGGRIFDDPVDVGLRQEAQEIDAARRHARIGRKRDHRNAASARHLSDRRDRGRKQRPENDFRAFVDRLLGGLCAPCGLPASSLIRS